MYVRGCVCVHARVCVGPISKLVTYTRSKHVLYMECVHHTFIFFTGDINTFQTRVIQGRCPPHQFDTRYTRAKHVSCLLGDPEVKLSARNCK